MKFKRSGSKYLRLDKQSIDNNTSSTDGLNAVMVAKDGGNIYAYTANSHDANFQTCSQGQSCSQLQIFNVRAFQLSINICDFCFWVFLHGL